jgi:hypothetical protein
LQRFVGPAEPPVEQKEMTQNDHDYIIKKAAALASTHKIMVQDVSGSRRHKAVYAVAISLWTRDMAFWNRKPIGQCLWEGKATATEMRNLCRDLKSHSLIDQGANETFQSSRSSTGYYVP